MPLTDRERSALTVFNATLSCGDCEVAGRSLADELRKAMPECADVEIGRVLLYTLRSVVTDTLRPGQEPHDPAVRLAGELFCAAMELTELAASPGPPGLADPGGPGDGPEDR